MNENTADTLMSTDEFYELCETGTPKQIKAAIEAGADVNARCKKYRETALMHAACNNADPGVIVALLEAGADIEAQDKYGNTALIHATWFNKNPEVAIALLKGGADVNARQKTGRTALIAAVHRSNPKLTSVLLEAGADANARTQRGETALMWAVRCSPRLLADNGEDAKAKDMSALVDGEVNDILKVLGILLESGADAKLKDNAGRTVLDYAEKNPELRGTDVLKRLREA